MSKIFKITFNVFLILIILVLISYLALRLTDKIRIYNVETGSMEDKIHTGDYILLYKNNQYYVGDVVTYQVDGYFVTHRIVSIDGEKMVTKGDANNKEDKEVNVSQIEGKVIYCGGILNVIIKYKFAFAAALIALYLLSCYFDKDEEEKLLEEIKKEEDLDNIFESDKKEETIENELEKEKVEEIVNEKETEIEDKEIEIIEVIEDKDDKNISEEAKEEITETKKVKEKIQKPKAKRTKKVETKEEVNEIKKDKEKVQKPKAKRVKKEETKESKKKKTKKV